MKSRRIRKAVNPRIDERKTAANVPYWRIADELGISENTMLRRMRHQLPTDQEAEVLEAIDRAAEKMETERAAEI